MQLEYLCDNKRHLICVPYSIEGLHNMARELGIGKWWFHKNHYDIPINKMQAVMAKCKIVHSKEIVLIIKNAEHANTINNSLQRKRRRIKTN